MRRRDCIDTGKTHVTALAFVCMVATGATVAQQPPDLWVLTESDTVVTIDSRTLAINGVIDLDNPFSFTGPTCIAFSTAGNPTAFVTHGSYVQIVDVRSETVGTPVDVAALIGVPEIQLTACSAATPRVFHTPVADITRSNLYVGGNLLTGEARWIVLDQEKLIAGSPRPLVASGLLGTFAAVVDAAALPEPQGNDYQRTWFTLVDSVQGSDVITSIPLVLPKSTSARPRLGAPVTQPIGTAGVPRSGVGVGVPPTGKLPIQPGYTTGLLENLETGDNCNIAANPTNLTVVGPGPNSYSVFAIDPLRGNVLAIDPSNCASAAFGVAADPVALVPRGQELWDGVFVIHNDGESVSFLEPDGDLSVIPLPDGSGGVDGGIAQAGACSVDNLLLDKNGEDIELSWTPVGCGPGAEFTAWCNCIDDDVACDCACDCTQFPVDPACACPFVPIGGASRGGIDGFLLDYNPGDIPTTNPWKKLEFTPGTQIEHIDVLTPSSWFYLVNPGAASPDP